MEIEAHNKPVTWLGDKWFTIHAYCTFILAGVYVPRQTISKVHTVAGYFNSFVIFPFSDSPGSRSSLAEFVHQWPTHPTYYRVESWHSTCNHIWNLRHNAHAWLALTSTAKFLLKDIVSHIALCGLFIHACRPSNQ